MGPAPRFRIAAIAELERQLRFAPKEARCREMDAAEQLLGEIDPQQTYPRDFVLFRITGYRSENADDPLALVGAALISDLAVFVQTLSRGLDLPCDYADRTAIPLDEVARRLNVSRKTVQRYRRQGLVCHQVRAAGGDLGLVCFEDALDRFQQRHAPRLRRAARFSRVDDDVVRSIVDDARRLRSDEGLTLNETAQRLAAQHARAHETVRTILRRADRRTPIFREHGPLGERDLRLIDRAAGRGVSFARLAARFGKTPATIRRAHLRHVADRLAAADVTWIELATFARDDAETVILAAPTVTTGLTDVLPEDDLVTLLSAARAARPVPLDVESPLLGGYNFLKRRARLQLDARPTWPGDALLDGILTDLRWALAVKRRLVSLALPAALGRLEQHLHRPLAEETAETIAHAVMVASRIAAEVIDGVDPSRDQRLSRMVAYQADRALAASTWTVTAPPGRAAARHDVGAVSAPRLYGALTAWQSLVALPPRFVARLDVLEPGLRDLILAYYGLGATPPATKTALADRTGTSRRGISDAIGAAVRILRTPRRIDANDAPE